MILSFIMSFIVASACAAEENFKSANSIVIESRHLTGQVVKKMDSPSLVSCGQACLRHSWCTSTNFEEPSWKNNCELNKHESSPINDDTKLYEKPGTTFTVFLKGCLMTGCFNGGSCIFEEQNETFVCLCRLPWKGDICELYETNLQSCNLTDLVASWSLSGSETDVILRDGALYKNEDDVDALYLDGNRSYADIPAVSLQYPAFTIMCWVKILEPAKTPGYIYADWSAPHMFSIWVHGEWKEVFFYLRNKLGEHLLAIGSSINFGLWVHLAVTWNLNDRAAEIFLNGIKKGTKGVENGLSNFEIMNNAHAFYQIGQKKDSQETFYGFVRDLKIFKQDLGSDKILEASRIKTCG